MSGIRRVTGSGIELFCDTNIKGPRPDFTVSSNSSLFKGDNSGRYVTFTTPLQLIPTNIGGSLLNLGNVASAPYIPLTQLPIPSPPIDLISVNNGGPLESSFRLITPHARVRILGIITSAAIGAGTVASTNSAILMPTFSVNILTFVDGIPNPPNSLNTFRILAQSTTSPSATTTTSTITQDVQLPGKADGTTSTLDFSIRFQNNFDKTLELQTSWRVIVY